MSGQPEGLLRLDGLVAGYRTPVTPTCSLTLARGEVLGLAGANGIGKSTLLAAIAGAARIHAGTLWLRPGCRLRQLPQRPERPAEAPVSGRELLAVMDALALPPPSRLVALLDARVDRLSGGEYQVLCLWACLAGDADLVLLDEPTNNLDRGHVDLAIEEIGAERARRGCIVVSHDRAFLDAVSTRVIDLGEMGESREAAWTSCS